MLLCFLSLTVEAVGLLVDNKVLCTRSDSSGLDNSFVNYSKNCATHCVHEIDCYQMPSPIKEISVTTCHAKGKHNYVISTFPLSFVRCDL